MAAILDAAHMSGTRFEGKPAGTDADVTVYSYHVVQNLATANSGMICFAQAEDDNRVRKLTWLGINKDTYARSSTHESYKCMYDVEDVGYKYHGNSIMAATALVQLKYLDRDNAYRRQLAAPIFPELRVCPSCRRRRGANLRAIFSRSGCKSATN